MTKVIIGAAEQNLATELRQLVGGIEDAQVSTFVETTLELSALVAREHPDVVFVHDRLGPQSTAEVVRDLSVRSPATGVLVINSTGSTEDALAAMEAGAKGVLGYPLGFDDFLAKFEVAQQWAERMHGLLSGAAEDSARELGRRGRISVFTGAKGGAGATTVATHMAIDLKRKVPGIQVCLVDLDLLAGDVSGILEARQRVSIADIAKVSQDLDAGTISDALVEHESGVSLLLAPLLVQETEFVTPEAVRSILGLLRQQFHVILVDGGSHVTPAQAAAVELADEVVVLVTPDVLSMRSYRRVVQAWEGLGVRTEQELHVLLNRVSREDFVNTDAVSKLTSAHLLDTQLPASFRRLERGVNSRNPNEVREASWWAAIEKVGAEVGVHGAPGAPAPSVATAAAKTRSGRRRSARRVEAEAGQITLETVVLVPVVALICLLVWQVGLTSLAFVWNGHAANAAARAQSMGDDPAEAARDAVPDGLRDDIAVTVADDGTVRVSTRVPILCPGCATLPQRVTQEAKAVQEP